MLRHFGVRSGVSATFAKTTVHKSIIHCVCPPIFKRTFSIIAQVKTKHTATVSSVLRKHNSVQQHTRPGQCSTCIKLHGYKLVVKRYFPPPKRPSPTPTVRLANVLTPHPPVFRPLPDLLLRGSPSTDESNCGLSLHSPLRKN